MAVADRDNDKPHQINNDSERSQAIVSPSLEVSHDEENNLHLQIVELTLNRMFSCSSTLPLLSQRKNYLSNILNS
jgi:hypothetical protein